MMEKKRQKLFNLFRTRLLRTRLFRLPLAIDSEMNSQEIASLTAQCAALTTKLIENQHMVNSLESNASINVAITDHDQVGYQVSWMHHK